MSDVTQAEYLAMMFHRTYEKLAPKFGYETRKESSKPWREVPEQNRQLMIAVCEQLLYDVVALRDDDVNAIIDPFANTSRADLAQRLIPGAIQYTSVAA